MECPARHEGCGRSRSTALQVDRLGPNAALCFLGSWLRAAPLSTEAEHRGFQPDVDMMQAYKEEHGW